MGAPLHNAHPPPLPLSPPVLSKALEERRQELERAHEELSMAQAQTKVGPLMAACLQRAAIDSLSTVLPMSLSPYL